MPRRQRLPSASELALWRQVVQDVRRMGEAGTEPLPVIESAPPSVPPTPGPAVPPGLPSEPRPVRRTILVPGPHNVDRRSWQRLQRGQYPITARLDLHGLTQAQAHDRLTRFIAAEHARGARCVLVITGMGARSGGVLRALAPRWLEAPALAPLVLAHAPARIGHGGAGALYVLLRRVRREGD